MAQKNLWISVVLAGLIIGALVLVNYSSNEFEKNINQYEGQLDLRFDQEHNRILLSLQENNDRAYDLFTDGFNKSVAMEKADTSYFLFSAEYEYPSINYLNCLESDVEAKLTSQANKKLNVRKKAEFADRFGTNGHSIINELEEDDIFTETYSKCNKYFGDRTYEVYSEDIWEDVEKILVEDTKFKVRAITENDLAEKEFLSDLELAYDQVRQSYVSSFENRIKYLTDDIMVTNDITHITRTEFAGSWYTNTEEVTYHSEVLQSILDNVLVDQWRGYALSTGSRPYAACFRTTNSCSGNNCSNIEVEAGGNDVITSIKNKYGEVVRHAYIESGDDYTFELPDGSYKVFFYSGSGWNPNKKMPSQNCRNLTGGFVERESFSKDPERVTLNNHVLEYELYTQWNGNFQTKGSNSAEAF